MTPEIIIVRCPSLIAGHARLKPICTASLGVLPHLNSSYFKKVKESNIREVVKGMKQKIYALDDESALKVVDGVVEVVSEGKWFAINE